MRSLFEIVCERCNSNDGNSACEAVVGELRAKLLRFVAVVARALVTALVGPMACTWDLSSAR